MIKARRVGRGRAALPAVSTFLLDLFWLPTVTEGFLACICNAERCHSNSSELSNTDRLASSGLGRRAISESAALFRHVGRKVNNNSRICRCWRGMQSPFFVSTPLKGALNEVRQRVVTVWMLWKEN